MGSDDLVEELAKGMHERWNEVKKSQGFHNPKDCKYRVMWTDLNKRKETGNFTCGYCHPDVDVHWEELPEDKKEINREGVKVFLTILANKGFRLVCGE